MAYPAQFSERLMGYGGVIYTQCRCQYFFAWVTQDLLPKVPQNSVIVMGNASYHKRKDILESIRSAGCNPEFLPTYSSDFNPIEHSWAQIKSICYKFRYSVDELFTSPNFK